MNKGFFVVILAFLVIFNLPRAAADTALSSESDISQLSSFSDPGRIWGSGAERILEEAYRLFFRTRIIEGRVMNIRMPFAQNHERDVFTDTDWGFAGGGKAGPAFLWERVNEILESDDFRLYTEALSDGREKVIIFDLPTQSWSITREHFVIARMKAGFYQGLLHRPYVLVSGRGVEETDVYNYLYCIGLVGIDCSGFVWHVLSYLAESGGVNLGRSLARTLGVRGGENPALYAGTSFFNSNSPQIMPVRDEIRLLRPADVILFRAQDGGMSHAAVIQSVDLVNGIIRYLQSTDEAPLAERGVHESFIFFNPENPALSLSHPSLVWTQGRYPPFPGERASPFSDDGKRYRAFPELGGGRVVRLRIIAEVTGRL